MSVRGRGADRDRNRDRDEGLTDKNVIKDRLNLFPIGGLYLLKASNIVKKISRLCYNVVNRR